MLLEKFDPSDKDHVEWLKRIVEADTKTKLDIIGENPMKQDFYGVDMIHIIFGLCAKYAQAVFAKTAYIIQ